MQYTEENYYTAETISGLTVGMDYFDSRARVSELRDLTFGGGVSVNIYSSLDAAQKKFKLNEEVVNAIKAQIPNLEFEAGAKVNQDGKVSGSWQMKIESDSDGRVEASIAVSNEGVAAATKIDFKTFELNLGYGQGENERNQVSLGRRNNIINEV